MDATSPTRQIHGRINKCTRLTSFYPRKLDCFSSSIWVYFFNFDDFTRLLRYGKPLVVLWETHHDQTYACHIYHLLGMIFDECTSFLQPAVIRENELQHGARTTNPPGRTRMISFSASLGSGAGFRLSAPPELKSQHVAHQICSQHISHWLMARWLYLLAAACTYLSGKDIMVYIAHPLRLDMARQSFEATYIFANEPWVWMK